MKVSEHISRLLRDYSPDDELVLHVWNKTDFEGVAYRYLADKYFNPDYDYDPYDEEAYKQIYDKDVFDKPFTSELISNAMDNVEKHTDSEVGITWDTLSSTVEDVYEKFYLNKE